VPCASCVGLWYWEAPHPQWRPTEPWSENVSLRDRRRERLLLFDPLAVPSELRELAAGRETRSCSLRRGNERDAQSLVERLGVPVYTPRPDTAQDLMDMYGLTDRAGRRRQSRPRLAAPREERRARPYSSGDRLPFVPTCSRHKANDTVLWVESRRAVNLRRHARRLGRASRSTRGGSALRDAQGDRRGAARSTRTAGRARACDARGPTDRAALERALSSS